MSAFKNPVSSDCWVGYLRRVLDATFLRFSIRQTTRRVAEGIREGALDVKEDDSFIYSSVALGPLRPAAYIVKLLRQARAGRGYYKCAWRPR